MKIIRKGKDPSNRVWRGNCRRCGCIAEAMESELTIVYSSRPGEGNFAKTICPECHSGELIFYPTDWKDNS